MFAGIDLFSDTVTKPTLAMKKAMMEAELGDEQKGEDPTTRKLEEKVANMLGFSAAMLFPSATMANEVAIRLLCEPGDELIAAENCHLFNAEAGGPAIHAAVIVKPICTENGIFTGEDVRRHYRWLKGPHYSVSKLINVENTTNLGGGIPWTSTALSSVLIAAKELNLKTHLDGSRLFNAVAATATSANQLVIGFDTVTLCFSKGLGCPTGAVLVFDRQYYESVRRLKQLMGGAMRQSGMLAAAALYALEYHTARLSKDHENAKILAKKLNEISAITVENNPPATNMIFFKLNTTNITSEQFLESCIKKGVRFSCVGKNRFRAVTHLDVNRHDVEKAANLVREIV